MFKDIQDIISQHKKKEEEQRERKKENCNAEKCL